MTLYYRSWHKRQPKQHVLLVSWHPRSKTSHLYSSLTWTIWINLFHAWASRTQFHSLVFRQYLALWCLLRPHLLSCFSLWLPVYLYFLLLRKILDFWGWVSGIPVQPFKCLAGTASTQEALGMCPSDAFSILYLNYHSEFITTTQFWVLANIAVVWQGAWSSEQSSKPHPQCQVISTMTDLSHKTFSTVERPLTSALLCPSQPAWLMQPLFSKGALGLEFKSLSPCWRSTGWRTGWHAKDGAFLMGKTLAGCLGHCTSVTFWPVPCLSMSVPHCILKSHELIRGELLLPGTPQNSGSLT